MTLQELQTEMAFTLQAPLFDELEKQNPILKYMRGEVHNYIRSIIKSGDKILELNAGTGMDALTFAEWNCDVLATDLSEGMLNELNLKKQKSSFGKNIETQQLSFNDLSSIEERRFNHVFSDFGGLNCSDNLEEVVKQIKSMLLPNGYATLVIMPPISPLEILTFLKGNKNAFRRFRKNGVDSKVENIHFKTYYYSVNDLKKYFGKNYKCTHLQSLCLFVPPPHADQFVKRNLKLFGLMKSLDKTFGRFPVLRNVGDHFIISFQKI